MKVRVSDLEEGLFSFARDIVATMPTTGHKFLAGIMMTSKAKAIEEALMAMADCEGHIDTDAIRKAVRSGFDAAGEKISFVVSDPRIEWLVRPVTVSLNAADVEKVIAEVESRCS